MKYYSVLLFLLIALIQFSCSSSDTAGQTDGDTDTACPTGQELGPDGKCHAVSDGDIEGVVDGDKTDSTDGDIVEKDIDIDGNTDGDTDGDIEGDKEIEDDTVSACSGTCNTATDKQKCIDGTNLCVCENDGGGAAWKLYICSQVCAADSGKISNGCVDNSGTFECLCTSQTTDGDEEPDNVDPDVDGDTTDNIDTDIEPDIEESTACAGACSGNEDCGYGCYCFVVDEDHPEQSYCTNECVAGDDQFFCGDRCCNAAIGKCEDCLADGDEEEDVVIPLCTYTIGDPNANDIACPDYMFCVNPGICSPGECDDSGDADKDCDNVVGAGYYCDIPGGRCKAIPEEDDDSTKGSAASCGTSSDCDLGYICDWEDFVCVKGCKADTDCLLPEAPSCVKGICQ